MANPTYQYSNGFDLQVVLPALKGRLKWKSEAGATPSGSGRYFDDGSFHELVDEKVFRQVQNTPSISDLQFQREKDLFETSAIMRALNSVFRAPEAIEKTLLFQDATIQLGTGVLAHDVLAWEFSVADNPNVIQRLDAVVLHFTEDTPVKLYLWRAGEVTPEWEFTAQAVGGRYTRVKLPACMISYARTKATKFYFGYRLSELENGAQPFMDLMERTPTVTFAAELVNVPALPVLPNAQAFPAYSFGLNVEVSSLWDFSDRIVENPELFDELIGLFAATVFLGKVVFSTRRNPTERQLDDSVTIAAHMDLRGAVPIAGTNKVDGIGQRIDQETKQVLRSFKLFRRGGVLSYG